MNGHYQDGDIRDDQLVLSLSPPPVLDFYGTHEPEISENCDDSMLTIAELEEEEFVHSRCGTITPEIQPQLMIVDDYEVDDDVAQPCSSANHEKSVAVKTDSMEHMQSPEKESRIGVPARRKRRLAIDKAVSNELLRRSNRKIISTAKSDQIYDFPMIKTRRKENEYSPPAECVDLNVVDSSDENGYSVVPELLDCACLDPDRDVVIYTKSKSTLAPTDFTKIVRAASFQYDINANTLFEKLVNHDMDELKLLENIDRYLLENSHPFDHSELEIIRQRKCTSVNKAFMKLRKTFESKRKEEGADNGRKLRTFSEVVEAHYKNKKLTCYGGDSDGICPLAARRIDPGNCVERWECHNCTVLHGIGEYNKAKQFCPFCNLYYRFTGRLRPIHYEIPKNSKDAVNGTDTRTSSSAEQHECSYNTRLLRKKRWNSLDLLIRPQPNFEIFLQGFLKFGKDMDALAAHCHMHKPPVESLYRLYRHELSLDARYNRLKKLEKKEFEKKKNTNSVVKKGESDRSEGSNCVDKSESNNVQRQCESVRIYETRSRKQNHFAQTQCKRGQKNSNKENEKLRGSADNEQLNLKQEEKSEDTDGVVAAPTSGSI